MKTVKERDAFRLDGFLMLLVGLAIVGIGIWRMIHAIRAGSVPSPETADVVVLAVQAAIAMIVAGLVLAGLIVIQPNDSRVLTFFGRYIGSVRRDGFSWINPLTRRVGVSLRVRNFNSERLKVNDARGNPIEIGAVVVWRVEDTARAVYDVDAYEEFVDVQSETAIRTLAQRFPYDSGEHGEEESLRGSPDLICADLTRELQARLDVAGVAVIEARISHLAYAQEIAQAMLRRQQAEAVIAARRQIVEGAVGMVEMGLRQLREQGVVDLDEERKAVMVNNLLVALVSESETQPIINTGSLYT